MVKVLNSKRVLTRSLIKYIFIGIFSFFFPIIQVLSFFAHKEEISFKLNGVEIEGLQAIMYAPVFSIVITVALTLSIWLALAIGIRIYSLFGDTKIKYIEINRDEVF